MNWEDGPRAAVFFFVIYPQRFSYEFIWTQNRAGLKMSSDKKHDKDKKKDLPPHASRQREEERHSSPSVHPHGLPSVGGRDLDPLGRREGGMIMDPRDLRNVHAPDASSPSSGPNLPPGSLPPGARFDPFAPPPPGSFPRPGHTPGSGPNPDHFRPPQM